MTPKEATEQLGNHPGGLIALRAIHRIGHEDHPMYLKNKAVLDGRLLDAMFRIGAKNDPKILNDILLMNDEDFVAFVKSDPEIEATFKEAEHWTITGDMSKRGPLGADRERFRAQVNKLLDDIPEDAILTSCGIAFMYLPKGKNAKVGCRNIQGDAIQIAGLVAAPALESILLASGLDGVAVSLSKLHDRAMQMMLSGIISKAIGEGTDVEEFLKKVGVNPEELSESIEKAKDGLKDVPQQEFIDLEGKQG